MSRKFVIMVTVVLSVLAIPVVAMACCEYDAEKDAYVCGGGDSKDGAVTNGGCGGKRAVEPVKTDFSTEQ